MPTPKANADDFAYVRAVVADRLPKADQALPRGVHLLLIEGYRPPAWSGSGNNLSALCAQKPLRFCRAAKQALIGVPRVVPH